MSTQVPTTTKAYILGEKQTRTLSDGKSIPYYDASLQERELPKAGEREVVVKITAAGFNHRELWIRKGQYPGIKVGSVLGADASGEFIAVKFPLTFVAHVCVGTVISGPQDILGKRVFIVPMAGWESAVRGPEKQHVPRLSTRQSTYRFGIVGGVNYPTYGTLSEYMVLPKDCVIPAPEHMTDEEAAAWGLGAVTAWRAVVTKGQVERGHNVFITGIGGGVAVIALLFCAARGANVFVSSSSPETIDKAIKLGAKGGVNYRDESWPKDLAALMKEHGASGLDAIIDSAGGDILGKTGRILNNGAKVVCYGM
ncbi:hypothetical protein FRC10_006158 [Ceratobasidium sp. 414]|nr:hypothetical protein FRC10_006158 [Ceratobasidium sp. 414]